MDTSAKAHLKIEDFSGGMTENYVDGRSNCAAVYDNLLITRNGKPFSRPGSVTYHDALNAQVYGGNVRISWNTYFRDQLFEQSGRQMYYKEVGWVPEDIVGPSGPVGDPGLNPFFGAGDSSSSVSSAEWAEHLYLCIDEYSLPRKMFQDQLNVWRVLNAGLPWMAVTPTVVPNTPGTKSYVWFVHYYYEYYVGNVKHVERGPVEVIQGINCDDPATGYNEILGIPILENGSTECYDVNNVTVRIYRTTDGGKVGKFVAEVPNGTTSYQDSTTDAMLSFSEDIYITGGVVDNEPPPASKYIVGVDGLAWYLNVQEFGENKPYRARQSLKGDLDSCPSDFYVDVAGEITGGSSIDIYPIVFTENRTYRFEGYVDSLGRGSTRVRDVSKTVGCVSQNSIVQVTGGLFFAGIDGFYFTDGFSVKKISNHLNQSYKEAVATPELAKKIYGTLDPISGRIYWAMTSVRSNLENDCIWVLDPYFGITPESTFTRLTGGDSFQPTALCFVNGDLVRSDSRGYSFRHSEDYFTDLVVDLSTTADQWGTQVVEYDWTSCAFSFGSDLEKKYITDITVSCKNVTNLSLQLDSCNDDSRIFNPLDEIRFRSNVTWGDPIVDWGDDTMIWNYSGIILAKRRMPGGGLRCFFKQIRFTNAFTVVLVSDSAGLATVDAINTIVRLDSGGNWPANADGFMIYFGNDNYTNGYEIVDVNGNDLEVLNSSGSLPFNQTVSWMIKGKIKTERIQIQAITIPYEFFGDSHIGFNISDMGVNSDVTT